MVWTWLEPMCHKECQEIFRKYVAKSVRLRKRIALACCSPLRKLTVSSMMEIAKSPRPVRKCHRPLPYQLLSVKALSRKDGQINPGIKKDQIRSNKIYWFLPVWFPLFESFRRQALEGVQKDVRRTVSVMQYNILAS